MEPADIDKLRGRAGGDTYYSAKQDDLERLYSDVTEEARNQYTLTFSPGDAPTGQDYHPIEVRVRRPGLNVRRARAITRAPSAPDTRPIPVFTIAG